MGLVKGGYHPEGKDQDWLVREILGRGRICYRFCGRCSQSDAVVIPSDWLLFGGGIGFFVFCRCLGISGGLKL
jgi:hypothetical protein